MFCGLLALAVCKLTLSFTTKDGVVIATVHPIDGQQAASVVWPEADVPQRAVDTSPDYQLEYLESMISRDWCDTTLLRITDDERVVYDSSICKVHGTAMTRQVEEEVSYENYSPYRKDYFDGPSPRLFPNDGKAYLLCGSGISHMKWRCPNCYRLSETWRKKHRIPQR